MKLALTKPKPGRKQHLVLVCTHDEAYRSHSVIREHILDRRYRPVREKRRDGTTLYRFNLRFLDRILLALPHAELSGGVEQLLVQNQEPIDLSNVPDLDIPGFDGQLWDFQAISVQTILDHLRSEDHNHAFLLNHEMGLGKTLIALSVAAIEDSFPTLVVVPNTVKAVWKQHVTKFFPMLTCTVIGGTKQQRIDQFDEPTDIKVMNYEALRLHQAELQETDWELVIADEFHRIKNPQAKQTKAFHGIKAKRKLLMSGTPMINGRAEELWSPLRYCWPSEWPSYFLFEKEHCIKNGYTVVGYRNLSKIRDFLHANSMRYRKDQVLQDLPEKVYSTRYVELSAEQRSLYDDIKEEFILWLEDGTHKTVNNVLSRLTRLKQACFSPELYAGSKISSKVNEVKEIVRELVANDEKAIIFSQWSRATRILQRELKQDYDVAYVDGSVAPKNRAREIQRFQEDPDCKLYIGTIGANKEGITLTAASYVIFTDKGWTPAENEQAAARAHRIGQQNTVHVIELQAQNTIEERIEAILAFKTMQNNMMVERDGGQRQRRVTMRSIKELL